MEGAQKFEIFVEYQIYCLNYCFECSLKFQLFVKYGGKFKWTNRSPAGNLSLVELQYTRYIVRFNLKL